MRGGQYVVSLRRCYDESHGFDQLHVYSRPLVIDLRPQASMPKRLKKNRGN